MKFSLALAAFLSTVCSVTAIPAPLVSNSTSIDWQATLQGTYQSISGSLSSQNFQHVITALQKIVPVGKPTSPKEFLQRLEQANSTNPATLYHYIANLRALNLIDSIDTLLGFARDTTDGENSSQNSNPDPNGTVIYPKKLSCDASYSTPESKLRSAIHIPSTFTWGKKPPVILFPGTGDTGFTTFRGNFIPLLQNSDFADPVWVNVPGLLLDNAQTNAEYAAYAINYISAMTRQKATLVAWSQGNIDAQWAFKYWPSTRENIVHHLAISPDYHGTVLADFISAGQDIPMPASILQQRYLESSSFITTLLGDQGDSAYVPTTTIHSSLFDEIVEPQQGNAASANLQDARNVGVTNNEVQSICSLQPAGSFYTHEGMLYNPLSFALLQDAMKNGGPGRVDRIDVTSLCTQYLTPGLTLGDLLLTENSLAIAGLGILLHTKMPTEPPRMAYANAKPVQNLAVCRSLGSTSMSTSKSTTIRVSSTSTSMRTPTLSSTGSIYSVGSSLTKVSTSTSIGHDTTTSTMKTKPTSATVTSKPATATLKSTTVISSSATSVSPTASHGTSKCA